MTHQERDRLKGDITAAIENLKEFVGKTRPSWHRALAEEHLEEFQLFIVMAVNET